MDERSISSQKVLSDETGLGASMISDILNEEEKPRELTVPMYTKLSDYFNVSVDWLLGRSDTRCVEVNPAIAAKVTGLADASIRALRQMQDFYIENDMERTRRKYRNTVGANHLFVLNVLLQSSYGAEILDDLYAYLTTDFEKAWYTEDKTETHPDGFEVVTPVRQNNEPIKILEFDSVINGTNQPVRVPVRFMKEAALRDMEGLIEKMRQSVLNQYRDSNREG